MMRFYNDFQLMKYALVVGYLLLVFPSIVGATSPPWPDETTISRLVEQALPGTTNKWDGYNYAQQDTRGGTFVAAGLLWRDGPYDRIAAVSILRGVLDLQYVESPLGVWKRFKGETRPDVNWREFVGCGLIIILETFSDRLPVDLVDDIQAALLLAAQGALKRDVPPEASNIAIMSAFLLDYVGTTQKREDMLGAGRNKAESVYALFSRHKTFDEYNSPTYYGVNIMGLALWRKFASGNRMKALGGLMEAELWRDIGSFYQADMKNMCGPFVRAYGMDMTKYYSLTGLWIALAINGDSTSMPWPVTDGRHPGDRVWAPIVALLGSNIPESVLPRLRHFTAPRKFKRVVQDQNVTVLIKKNLMMGATWLPQRSEQYHPATIYWRISSGHPVGWILLSGLSGQDIAAVVDVENERLRIGGHIKSKESIQFLIYAPDLAPGIISQNQWDLPGLLVSIQTSDGVMLESVHLIEHKYYGGCLEARYSVSPNVAADTPLLTLWPQEKSTE